MTSCCHARSRASPRRAKSSSESRSARMPHRCRRAPSPRRSLRAFRTRQVVDQFLAAHAERGADEIDAALREANGLRIGIEHDDGAAHFRRRVERLRLERHEDARRGVEADEEREVAVRLVAGLGHEAVRDLLLQHEDGAAAVRIGDDAAQDRRAGVVGEIADGAVRAGGQRRVDGVFVDELDAVAELRAQPRRKLGIDLDGDRARSAARRVSRSALLRPGRSRRRPRPAAARPPRRSAPPRRGCGGSSGPTFSSDGSSSIRSCSEVAGSMVSTDVAHELQPLHV